MPSIAAQQRIDWLMRQLAQRGVVKLQESAEFFGVTEMTIRRDLNELESQGLAKRIRGGAVSLRPPSFESRSESAIEEKRQIAAKLLPLVPDEGLIAFDSSTTILRLAQLLERASNLTILTNSPRALAAVAGKSGITCGMVAGTFDARSDSLVGPLARATVGQITCDAFFCSATAVHPTWGCSEATLEEAEVKRALAERSGRVILAANSDKLGESARARSVELGTIDILVTELPPASEALDAYRAIVPSLK